MYAVGKVSSFISRSVYTASGPFHPFGGAVDIVVVQQQDGSFKSSPWYVRFGKFQGVLKTREKVVNIAVNGIEAGFHMYLDSNGEAYFLRDADSNIEEGEFVVSPASSGDEREVPMQDAQLRKSKSTCCDSSTMEANVGDGKILARTSSRRITILDRMFGRKSIKDNAHTVSRVSSLERAEIAAELLDTKWSTNPSRGSRTRSSNDDEPSKGNVTDVVNDNLVETSKMVLPECSSDHEKAMGFNRDIVDSNFGSQHGGRNSSGDENDHYIQTTNVTEEVVEIYTRETGDLTDGITSTTNQPGLEYLSNHLGSGKRNNESFDIQGELLGNFEDVTGREMRTKKVPSHGIFEINAIETDITNSKSEVVSQFVTVDSVGADQTFTAANSPTYGTPDVSSESHDVSLIPSAEYTCQEKVVIISSPEAVERSYDVSDILADKVCDSAGISLADGVQLEECSSVSSEKIEQLSFEKMPLSYYGASSNKEMNDLDVQDRDVVVFEDSRSQISQTNGPDKDISVDTVANYHIMYSVHGSDINISADTVVNDHSTHPANDLGYQHDLIFPDASSSVAEILSYVPENGPEEVTKDSSVENKTYNAELDVSVIQISTMGDETRESIAAQSANIPNKDELEGSQIISEFSSLSNVEANNTKLGNDENRASSTSGVEIGFVPENDPEEVTKDSSVENKTCNGEIDVSVIQKSTMGDKTRECIAQSANFPNKVELEGSQIISVFSSLGKGEADNAKLEDDVNRASSASRVEIGLVPEVTHEPGEEAEAVVTFSEFVEEIQFQFSDTENFADRYTMDDVIANKAAGAGEHDESDCDAEEQGGDDTDLENDVEYRSDSSRPETSPVPIPGSELRSGDNNIEAKSLPNLRSHIHDLERSDSFQLSRSLQSSGENNGVDPVKSINSCFPEQEPDGTGDLEENSARPELTKNAVPDDKHADDLKVDSFNPFVELSLCRHLLSEGMGVDAACKAFDAEKVTLENFRTMKQSLIRNNKLVVRIAGRYFPWDAATPIILGMVSFREEQVFEPQGMIKVERVEPSAAQGGSWRIWPFSFRRTRTITTVQPVCESTVESSLSTSVKESDGERNKPRAKRMERKVRSFTPTSEELASLDLREGRNVVTFTFSTAMLGRQQVDAHIYLWKWNTRIVISDVDGTITKSDVLGQFMPLVGVDWSQNGVTHLFSAIKENGYQLLFLSARAISQAHLTRQFLFNLKQDGKALPDGPVVISPDGLFPSLYREVIRRAPHEFKISCLEAIKALFPPDTNPFYAGFGNRDTDEFSYLKVGIPMGKIFIINPKGEVAVNRRVDTKSYTSLHALVNGMFPPISSSSEQEDYNTWNYWKIPLTAVDI